MRYLLILFVAFACLPLNAAATTTGLYRAEVEVADQGAQARTAGMQQALSQVLVKVSGSALLLEDPSLRAALPRAVSYAQRYQYRTEALSPAQQHLDDSGRLRSSRLLMEVEFETRSIDALLREYGYPVWGRVRPMTLVWMAVEDGGQRVLVGADDGGLVRQVLERSAVERALPLSLPLLDLADQQQVEVADVWGGFYDVIERASARYQAQAVLVGRLKRLGGQQWEAQWTLLQGGERQSWQQRSADVAVLIAGGVEQSTEWLAGRFAKFAQDSEGQLWMRVEGVTNLHDYRRVVEHLGGINGVQAIRLASIEVEGMQLALNVEGGRDALQRTIALGRVLERAGTDEHILYYRLRQ